MAEYNIGELKTREDFNQLIAGLREEARDRGWLEQFCEVIESAGVGHLLQNEQNEYHVMGKIFLSINTRLAGGAVQRAAEATHNTTGWITTEFMTRRRFTHEGPLSECCCPAIPDARALILSEAQEHLADDRASGRTSWVGCDMTTVRVFCESDNCKNDKF